MVGWGVIGDPRKGVSHIAGPLRRHRQPTCLDYIARPSSLKGKKKVTGRFHAKIYPSASLENLGALRFWGLPKTDPLSSRTRSLECEPSLSLLVTCFSPQAASGRKLSRLGTDKLESPRCKPGSDAVHAAANGCQGNGCQGLLSPAPLPPPWRWRPGLLSSASRLPPLFEALVRGW